MCKFTKLFLKTITTIMIFLMIFTVEFEGFLASNVEAALNSNFDQVMVDDGGGGGAACSHSYSIATCTKPKTCTKCGAAMGSALGHSYSVASCTKPKTCTRCKVTSGSALGHSYTIEYETGSAEKHAKISTCTRCNYSTEVIENHTFDSSNRCTKCGYVKVCSHSYTEATCTAAKKCIKCNVKVGGPLGHSYAAATCTKPKTCIRCNETSGSALGHNLVTEYESGSVDKHAKMNVCTKCNYSTEVIENHTFNSNNVCTKCGYTKACTHSYSEATCTTAKKCTRCNVSVGGPLGHSYAAANCTTAKRCTRCNATMGSALGHDIVIEYETGSPEKHAKISTCTRCNYSTEVIENHTFDSSNRCTKCGYAKACSHSYTEATCTTAKKCTKCNVTVGGPLGHSYSAATCTKSKICIRCNVTSGSALGHSYTTMTLMQANCVTEGRKADICTRCNLENNVQTIPALGHAFTAATCTKPKTCTRCNATSGSVLAHDYNIKAGKFYNDTYHYERYKCSCGEYTYINYQKHILDETGRCVYACGYVKKVDIEECTHTYNWVTIKNATCKESGIKENKCTKCGKIEKTETIPMKAHDYRNATCTEPKTCKNCGVTSGNAPGHTFNIKGEMKYNSNTHYEVWKCLCGQSENRNQKSHEFVNDKCKICGFEKAHEHKFIKTEVKFNSNTHYDVYKCTCGQTENRNQKSHEFLNDKCKVCGFEKAHEHKFTKSEVKFNENTHYDVYKCSCGQTENRNQKSHEFVNDKCKVCGFEKAHEHKFTKSEVKFNENTHYDVYKCSCGQTENRNQKSHEFVNDKCKVCGFKKAHEHKFEKKEIKYNENTHYEVWKCSCGQSENRNQGSHELINNKCNCGYVFVCKHSNKRIEYVYRNTEEHINKTICVNCNEVVKEETAKHNNSVIEIKSINAEKHTKTMQCKECSKKYYVEEKHVLNNKNMCECGFVKENEEIKVSKITFEGTKNNAYTIEVGERINLLEKVKITPNNAKVDLRFIIVSGENGVATIETYTGRLEAKKAMTEGIKVRVVDMISNVYAEVVIKIKENPDVEEETETLPPQFEDVEEDSWYEDDVNNAVQDGIFNGTSENTFSPNSPITRGMFVTVLARMDKADVENFANIFEDVKEDAYYQESISWAVANGIASGVGDGKFAPDAQITREAMAVMLYNYINISHKGLLQNSTNAANFTDKNEIASWALDEVMALKAIGLINGKSDGNFKPKDVVTRAEAAVVLQRLSEMIKTDEIVNQEKCSANIIVDGHRQKLIMSYKFVTNDVHAIMYKCDICKTEWEEKTIAHSFENAKCICGHVCTHNGSKITEQGYNTQNKLVERTICENCKAVISEKIIQINTSNYSPSDFSQYKPVMTKDSYTDADWDRMEAELKARVEAAGYGTRAGVVEAALYLASLDYAMPYRGTPMDRGANIGSYPEYGLNRTWGKSVKTTKKVEYNGNVYPKGYSAINGMDCGSFVTWAFINGGVIDTSSSVSYKTSALTREKGGLSDRMKRELDYSNLGAYPLNQVAEQVEPGDVIYTYSTALKRWSHIGLIVGVDEDNVYVAESNTTTYSPDTEKHSLTVNKLVVTRIPKTYKGDVLGYVVLCDDKIYTAKNPDGTENKGNMPQVWGN